MKKNIKRAFIIILGVAIILTAFTACSSNADNTTSSTAEAATETTAEDTTADSVSLNMEDVINSEADGKPIVTIHGDEEVIFSFDFSENMTSKVEVTIDEKINDDHFYVTMAGDVTEHTLFSDGSLFDGLAYIENGKAEFSVTYGGERTIDFVVNVK